MILKVQRLVQFLCRLILLCLQIKKQQVYALFGIVILKSSISVLFYSHKTVRRTISQCVALYNCEAISLVERRIKLRECPQDTHAFRSAFFNYILFSSDYLSHIALAGIKIESKCLFNSVFCEIKADVVLACKFGKIDLVILILEEFL